MAAPTLASSHRIELRLIDSCHITQKSVRVSALQGHEFNFYPAGSSGFPTQFGPFKEGRRAFKYFFLTAPGRNYLLCVDNCCCCQRSGKGGGENKTTPLISRSWPISGFCGSVPSFGWHFGWHIHQSRSKETGFQWQVGGHYHSVFFSGYFWGRCRPREPLHMQIWLRERLIILNVPIIALSLPDLLQRYRQKFHTESHWWHASWIYCHTQWFSISID